MRYLFFDIECSDGTHICEFGYIITDENFNAIYRESFTVNPEAQFKLSGRHEQSDIKLSFTEEEYRSSPTFPHFYQKIKDLIEAPDQLVFWHSVNNDANFLNIACEKYSLPYINFRFHDSQRLYIALFNVKSGTSLEKVAEALSLPIPEKLHKSDEDAVLTMQVVRALCQRENRTLNELIASYPVCVGRTQDGEICFLSNSVEAELESIEKDVNSVSMSKRRKLFREFIENVRPTVQTEGSLSLKGKKIALHTLFERRCFKHAVALVQEIYNRGGSYTDLVSECNVFLDWQGKDENGTTFKCGRLDSIKSGQHGKRKVIIVDVEQFILSLGLNFDELGARKLPPAKLFKKQKFKAAENVEGKASLLAILKAKGVDVSKL